MNTEELKKYDFILLLDKSGSMGEPEKYGSPKTRWEAAQEGTVALARECIKYDDNGITVVPFARTFKVYENVKEGDQVIKNIFTENEPNGGTDTAKALKFVLDQYIASKGKPNCKPIIVIVVTDGIPDSERDLQNVIIDASKKIDNENEIGIEFLQIGDNKSAREFLKNLDNNLTGAKFDIVNTKTMDELEGVSLSEALISAITE